MPAPESGPQSSNGNDCDVSALDFAIKLIVPPTSTETAATNSSSSPTQYATPATTCV
ncbi:UNVERIFIED_ORG: hypothetical protein J2X79_004296 [Arthrobacter globiformis]|nr:hypothetical protein [Arthrobacter globiformis]